MIKNLILLAALTMVACQQASDEKAEPAADEAATSASVLADILAAQPDDVRARYEYRHPQGTLEVFEIEPGMTVVEGLPGGCLYEEVDARYGRLSWQDPA